MTVVATAPASVAIQTCPQEVPSLPAWFAEVTLLAHHLTQRGILDAVCEQVHLARGRAGHYEVESRLSKHFSSTWHLLPIPLWRFLAVSGFRTARR